MSDNHTTAPGLTPEDQLDTKIDDTGPRAFEGNKAEDFSVEKGVMSMQDKPVALGASEAHKLEGKIDANAVPEDEEGEDEDDDEDDDDSEDDDSDLNPEVNSEGHDADRFDENQFRPKGKPDRKTAGKPPPPPPRH